MVDADIGRLMSAANDEVSRDNPEALFVTAFAAILDLDTGELTYSNAGHDDPYVMPPGSAPLVRLSDGDGPPLCAFDGFPYSAGRRQMRRGEVLCLVTDGVTEARDGTGGLYGGARLQALLARCASMEITPRALVDALLASVDAFAGRQEAADDLTVLAVHPGTVRRPRRVPSGRGSRPAGSAAPRRRRRSAPAVRVCRARSP